MPELVKSISSISNADSVKQRETSVFEKIFSPCGADRSPRVVYYVVWDWASKATVISFNLCNPLLVTSLGNEAFGSESGKLLWSYLSSAIAIFTALCFLTFMAIIEYEDMKQMTLFHYGRICAICLILFAFCFEGEVVYLAVVLAFVSKISFNVSNLAFDSILNSVSRGKDTHQISSRSFLTGYVGVVLLGVLLVGGLALLHSVGGVQSTVILGNIANVCVGVWYLVFGYIVWNNFPPAIGRGPPFPQELTRVSSLSALVSSPIHASSLFSIPATERLSDLNSDFERRVDALEARRSEQLKSEPFNRPAGCYARCVNWMAIVWFGFLCGVKTQIANIKGLHRFLDLCRFIVAFVFVEGASNTGVSLAAIIVVDLFSVSVTVLAICGGCGIFFSILGLFLYKSAHQRYWISPKTVLVINIFIFILIMLGLLFVTDSNAKYLFILFSVVGGSQLGSVGAFSRSIVADLTPTCRQSSMFSLYQFSQISTAWIGPLIVASVNTATGGNNREFLLLTVFVVVAQLAIGLPMLLLVDMKRGQDLRAEVDLETSS